MTLVDAFSSMAATRLNKTAVYWGEMEFSYERVRGESDKIARHLRSSYGVQPGDRIGLWLKNRPEFIFSLFGILQADAVAVPINNFLKPHEVRFILDDAGIDVLITDNELSMHVAAFTAARASLKVLNIEAGAASVQSKEETLAAPKPREGSALAILIYT